MVSTFTGFPSKENDGRADLHRKRISRHCTDEKRFGSLPSWMAHTIMTIHPTSGMHQSSRNHALLFVSCSRRAPTAREGSRTPSENSADSVSLTMPAATDARVVKRNHHQYSDREARPSNAAYFEKQVLMDSSCLPIVVYEKSMNVASIGVERRFSRHGPLPGSRRWWYGDSRRHGNQCQLHITLSSRNAFLPGTLFWK